MDCHFSSFLFVRVILELILVPEKFYNKLLHQIRAKGRPSQVRSSDGADASRPAIGAAYCHPLAGRRFSPVHQAAEADSRPHEQARASACC
jgi:hypothetical protein